mmetsp:Transcript_29574/g.80924  ORF Transcript_29574/g.80924 Transcript_29574/m.80924 type:complete len:294 (-) Transcript_29574:718-1599(-)
MGRRVRPTYASRSSQGVVWGRGLSHPVLHRRMVGIPVAAARSSTPGGQTLRCCHVGKPVNRGLSAVRTLAIVGVLFLLPPPARQSTATPPARHTILRSLCPTIGELVRLPWRPAPFLGFPAAVTAQIAATVVPAARAEALWLSQWPCPPFHVQATLPVDRLRPPATSARPGAAQTRRPACRARAAPPRPRLACGCLQPRSARLLSRIQGQRGRRARRSPNLLLPRFPQEVSTWTSENGKRRPVRMLEPSKTRTQQGTSRSARSGFSRHSRARPRRCVSSCPRRQTRLRSARSS